MTFGARTLEQPCSGRVTVLLFVGMLTAACSSRDLERSWLGSVDTLATGEVLVRNPSSGVWDSRSAWRIEEELRIGSAGGDGPDVFGRVAALAIDSRDRVYVLDRQARVVRVFDRDGRYVRTLGRPGAGPGEFEDPIAIEWLPNQTLVVVDQRNARYTIYDTNGTYIADPRRAFRGLFSEWRGGVDTAGRFYDVTVVPDRPGALALVQLDAAFMPRDTFGIPHYEPEVFRLVRGSMTIAMAVPFTTRLVWTFDPRGFIWFGETKPYRIRQRTLAGAVVRILEKEYEPARVERDDRERALQNLHTFVIQGGVVDEQRIPAEKPAFSDMIVDDQGYLWVRPTLTEVEDSTLYAEAGPVFDVFDPEGRYLGRALADVALQPPMRFTRGALYGVTRDEFDVEYVVRTRVRGNRNASAMALPFTEPTPRDRSAAREGLAYTRGRQDRR